jgi:hypothetical protein
MLAAMLGMAPGGTAAGHFTRDLRFESRAIIRGGKRRMADGGATWRHAIFHIQTAGAAHEDTSPRRQGCVLPAQRSAGRWPTAGATRLPATPSVARGRQRRPTALRPPSEATIRKAMGTAFTRHAGSPNAIIEDVRG